MDAHEKKHRRHRCLSQIPRKIIMLHDRDNVSEFILHDICHENCFNLNRAAFFIDSPDFDCLKGVVGYSRPECKQTKIQVWENHCQYVDFMNQSPFNKMVRSILRTSLKKSTVADEDIAHGLAQELGMKHHRFCSLPLKHDNHGIFLYEIAEKKDFKTDELVDGLSLLGFCPVF